MTELRIGDQVVRYDRAATVAAYAAVQHGLTDGCRCSSCRNFAAQRDLSYPASFRRLLDELGIDPCKEDEVYETGPAGDDWRGYGGWFHLVGEMVAAGERNTVADDCGQFEFFFRTSGSKATAFRDGPILALEFTTRVKWVLAKNPE
jgi:hypothetical protein